MDYLVLIQARCGSSRLPNKVLKEFSGKTDLEWVVERVSHSRRIDEIMVITSIEKNNLPLIRLCADLDVRVFVGSENDVLDRYYQAARLLNPRYVIRITADCPLFDWTYLDMAIDSMEDSVDYLCEADGQFPDGLDIEIIRFDALKKAWLAAKMLSEREHVTLYIRNHPELFNIKKIDCPISGIGNMRWTLDETEDYCFISAVYEHFVSEGKSDFLTKDVLGYLSENPELSNINSMFERNEGLARSLREDRKIEETV